MQQRDASLSSERFSCINCWELWKMISFWDLWEFRRWFRTASRCFPTTLTSSSESKREGELSNKETTWERCRQERWKMGHEHTTLLAPRISQRERLGEVFELLNSLDFLARSFIMLAQSIHLPQPYYICPTQEGFDWVWNSRFVIAFRLDYVGETRPATTGTVGNLE